MKKTFIFLFVMCFSVVKAQISIVEIDKKHNASKHLLSEGKSDECIKVAKEIVEESRKIGYSKGIAKGNFRLSKAYYMKRESNSCIQYALLAQKEEYTASDYELKTNIDQMLGVNYAILDMNDVAISAFKCMIRDAEKNSDPDKKLLNENKAYHYIAGIYTGEKNMDSAYYYHMKIYTALEDKLNGRNPKLNILFLNAVMGIKKIYHLKKNKDSVEFSKKITALLLKTSSITNEHISNVYTYNLLANIFFEEKKYEEAKKYNDLFIKLSRKFNSIEYLNKAYDLQYKISEKLNNLPKAQKELKEYVGIKDSVSNIDKKNIRKSFRDIIAVKNEKIEAEKQNENRLLTWITIIVLLFITSLFVFKKFVGKKNREKEVVVLEKETKIYDLQAKVNVSFQEVILLAKTNSSEFLTRFQEVYPEFCIRLMRLYPEIQSSELAFCGYLKLNFSTKDIAKYTFVTPKTIQMRKYRLRKKFGIPSDKDFYLWMKDLDRKENETKMST